MKLCTLLTVALDGVEWPSLRSGLFASGTKSEASASWEGEARPVSHMNVVVGIITRLIRAFLHGTRN